MVLERGEGALGKEEEAIVWTRLKEKTEDLLMAAQSLSLRTNAIKVNIVKCQGDPLCRMGRTKEETVNHLLCECPNRAQTEYKRRHDGVGRVLL